METSPLIFSTSQWAAFYMIETSVIKELIFSLYSASPLVNVVEKVPITNRTAICSDDSQLVPTMSPPPTGYVDAPPTGYVDAQQIMNVRLVIYSFYIHCFLCCCCCCCSKKKRIAFCMI